MSTRNQYARQAEGWSEGAYADARSYLAHRADLVVSLGEALAPGETVLDLACGDGGLGVHLLERGLLYRGVDAESAMVAAAARRLGPTATVSVGDLDTYTPPEPVACTTVFRAIYYTRDRSAFFRRVREFTTGKLVFDLNPRRFDVDAVRVELLAAGFAAAFIHPFLLPQTRRLPRSGVAALLAAERSAVLSRALLRARFTYLVAAVVGASALRPVTRSE